MKHFARLLQTAGIILSVSLSGSCSKDNGPAPVTEPQQVNGAVQKGPFITGTSITVRPLDERLETTGKSYETQITDDLGNFMLPEKISAPYAELTAHGYYFNEVDNSLSHSQITLRSITRVSDGGNNINLLTTLEAGRLRKLVVEERKPFEEARKTAQREVLASFGITLSDAPLSDRMDISAAGEANAALLAVSAVMQGSHSEAELSELIAKIANDIRDNGRITQPELQASIRTSSMQIDPDQVRKNLVGRYSSLGMDDVPVSDFYDYVDSDGDGQINGMKPYVLLTDRLIEIDCDAKSIAVGVRSNREWEVVIAAELPWIRRNAETAPDRLVLDADPNPGMPRSAKIIVKDKASAAADTLIVKQFGNAIALRIDLNAAWSASSKTIAPSLKDLVNNVVLIGFDSQGKMLFNRPIASVTDENLAFTIIPPTDASTENNIKTTLYVVANDFDTYKQFQGTEAEFKAIRTTQDLNRLATPVPLTGTVKTTLQYGQVNVIDVRLQQATARVVFHIQLDPDNLPADSEILGFAAEGIGSQSGLLFPPSQAADTTYRNDLQMDATEDNTYSFYAYGYSTLDKIRITVGWNGIPAYYVSKFKTLILQPGKLYSFNVKITKSAVDTANGIRPGNSGRDSNESVEVLPGREP